MKTILKQNEKVALTIRKHWFVLLQPILSLLIICLIIAILTFVIKDSDFKNSNYLFYGTIITITIAILRLIYTLVERNNNLWAVTNLRVIDEFGVFTNNSKETPLDKINNVSYRQPVLGSIFNYGNAQIQSTAESGSAVHKMVTRPKILKDSITKYQELNRLELINHQAQSLAKAVHLQTPHSKHTISEEISTIHNLKEKVIITENDFEEIKKKTLNN